MPLERAEWHDVLTVLRESASIWSAGLNPHDYRRYIWLQMSHYWGRSNYRFFVYKDDGVVKSSCKLYNVTMEARGRQYNFVGVGAVHTLDRYRGQGYARYLLEDVLALSEVEKADGVILFSDIGPELYEEFGFVEIGSAEFSVHLDFQQHNLIQSASPAHLTMSSEDPRFKTLPLKEADLSWLSRHHRRWLRNQPFGVVRDLGYWHYKIVREDFLNLHSSLQWPQLQLTMLDAPQEPHGYAIFENAGNTLRIMEVVGGDEARHKIWQHLFDTVQLNKFKRIRGWESVIREFAPNYKFSQFGHSTSSVSEMHYTERSWGRCMMLPFNPDADEWLDVNLCPLLELDHL